MNERWLDFVFGLSSLIGLVVTTGVMLFAVLEGDYETQPKIMVFSLAAINLALAVVCVVLFRRSDALSRDNAVLRPTVDTLNAKIQELENAINRKNSDFGEIADVFHSIHDQLRDKIFELYDAHMSLLSGDKIKETELVDYERTNEMFYLFLLNNIKTIFDILTDDKCSACIKILEEGDSENEIMVRTFMRDSGSYRERKSSDKSICQYPYYENTAFKRIFSPDIPDGYYASDDLASERTYINMNKNWRKYYNATLVCPIRLESISDRKLVLNEYSVIGFICIDNFKGGLNNHTSVQLLAAISDSLYNHFSLFNELKNVSTSPVPRFPLSCG